MKKTQQVDSSIASLTMIFKLVQSAEKGWQRLHSSSLVPLVMNNDIKFVDGVQHAA